MEVGSCSYRSGLHSLRVRIGCEYWPAFENATCRFTISARPSKSSFSILIKKKNRWTCVRLLAAVGSNLDAVRSTSSKVTTTLQQASQHGLNVARTWAFSNGGYRSLQVSPGSYDENVFKVLHLIIKLRVDGLLYTSCCEAVLQKSCSGEWV